jgi:uncharacterized protein YuzE
MEKRRFQWLKGDMQGKIETYKTTIRENDVDYLLFQSGKRVSTDLIGDYITEISEDGEPFISSEIFNAGTVINTPPINKKVQQNNIKKSNLAISVEDIILKQLEKSDNKININIQIPLISNDFFKILSDAHNDILTDLIKIITAKYINKDNIEDTLKKEISKYYYNSDIIDLKTEKVKTN